MFRQKVNEKSNNVWYYTPRRNSNAVDKHVVISEWRLAVFGLVFSLCILAGKILHANRDNIYNVVFEKRLVTYETLVTDGEVMLRYGWTTVLKYSWFWFPAICGGLATWFTWLMVYLDSSVPGIQPPSPLSPARYNDQDQHSETSEYTNMDKILINLVQQFPHLFDRTNKNFRYKIMKDNTWTEIASVINLPVVICQNRWQCLRDRWIRENRIMELKAKIDSKGTSEPKWALFEQMKFLKNHVTTRKQAINVNMAQSIGAKHSNVVSNRPMLEEGTTNIIVEKTDKSDAQDGFNIIPSTSFADASFSSEDKPESGHNEWSTVKEKTDSLETTFQKLLLTVTKHLSETQQRTVTVLDADELFCKFITAELKKKSKTQKDELKQEIIKLIFSKQEDLLLVRSGHTFHLNYIFAVVVGLLVFIYMYLRGATLQL